MQQLLETLEVTFVTCGQTQAESSGLCEDEFSGCLTKTGRQQAQRLAAALNFKDYRVVICSPSSKAVETCGIIFPDKKPVSLSLAGPFKYGCLAHHPIDSFYSSLLNSSAPEREFKVKGSENLELLRRRIKEFFTRLACAMLWDKQDGLLGSQKSGNKVLVITHEIWIAELVHYIRERNERLAEIIAGKPTDNTDKSEPTEDEFGHKKVKQVDASPEVLETYNKYGVLPYEDPSPLKKIKVLEAKRIEEKQRSKELSLSRSRSPGRRLRLTIAEREVPPQYQHQGHCSMTVIAVTCGKLADCRSKPRSELSDDFLQYALVMEQTTDYSRPKPSLKTLKTINKIQ